MATRQRTFLVECFVPGVREATVAADGDRARAVAADMTGEGVAIAYEGAMLVAEDEVVFHAFTARDAGAVREASRRAGLPFERIVESIGVAGEGDADTVATRLIRADAEGPPR